MDRTDGQYPYIKLFPEEYQGGSLHYGCTLEERGFFVDLLCLAGKNRKERGTLSLEKGIPMKPSMLANAIFISEADCIRLLGIMEEQERIEYREDGVIEITNFEFYQKKYRRSKLVKDLERQNAIIASQEVRTRKHVRHNPEVATDELVKISEEKHDISERSEEIEALENKGRKGGNQ